MVFTNDMNPRVAFKKSADGFLPTVVKKNASIGANATIVCGVTIGQNAFVGAGSVVIRDVPAYAVVAGNPARRIGWMCACGQKLPKFSGEVSCPACSRRYRLESDAAGLLPA
jgi:acetyltransferase-like isoleucine patch superfamily enzyme